MIHPCEAAQSRSAMPRGEASSPLRAMRHGPSAYARRCRRARRFANALTWCSCRQGSRSIGWCLIRFARSSPTTRPSSSRSRSTRPISTFPKISEVFPTASATAAEIRARIFEETGLTASAGISYNKFLAKLASDHCKPNGQFVVTPAMTAAFVETLPIGKFHGVGPVTANKMKRLGIFTGADLRRQSLEFLQQHFGKSGIWYHAIANGEDNRPVVPDRPRKSSGSERTFANDLTDPAAIEAGVLAMADEVWAWCEKTRVSGRTVTVKIKYADFRQVTRSRTLAAMITSQETLRNVSIDLVRTVFPPAKGIRLLGVTLSSFENAERSASKQLDLGLVGRSG